MKTGRPISIPASAFADVRRWHRLGYGCRRIAAMLGELVVYTTKSSVERLLRGRPPYDAPTLGIMDGIGPGVRC